MLMDNNLRLSSGQVITATADSTFTYDILKGNSIVTAGGTYAVPPTDIIGNAAFFGEDLGRGRGVGEPVFVVSALAGVPAGGTSISVAVMGAADNGGGTIAGLTFVPYATVGPVLTASILAPGRLASIPWPKRPPSAPLPRFVKLTYTVAGANFTGLAVNADVTLGPDDALGTIQNVATNF